MAVRHVLPSNQEHVVVPPPFPQYVQFRASQSGSEHTAASAVPTGSSVIAGLSVGTSPQATSNIPDSNVRRADFFMVYGFTVFSLEWIGAGVR